MSTKSQLNTFCFAIYWIINTHYLWKQKYFKHSQYCIISSISCSRKLFPGKGTSFVFPFPDRSRRSYRALTQTNFAIVPPAIWLPHLNNFIFARKKFLTWIRPGRLYLAGNLRKQFLYNWKTFFSGCLWSGVSFVAQWLEELLF